MFVDDYFSLSPLPWEGWMFLDAFIVGTGEKCGNGAKVFTARMFRAQVDDHVCPRLDLACPPAKSNVFLRLQRSLIAL